MKQYLAFSLFMFYSTLSRSCKLESLMLGYQRTTGSRWFNKA